MCTRILFIPYVILALLIGGFSRSAHADVLERSDAVMKMHHLHIMMNKGIILATEGSNLVMLAEMNMLPSVDEITLHHGHQMIKESKPLIHRTLSGPVIMDVHKKGYINDPLLHYTDSLGKAILDLIEILETMDMGMAVKPDLMKMNHLHTMLNHALEMAAEGSNLCILGQMGKTGKVMDTFSIQQGMKMMENARSLVEQVMQGKTMQELHQSGVTPQTDTTMKDIHRMAEASSIVIDKLLKMPRMDVKIEVEMP